jgi:hypothetical protein
MRKTIKLLLFLMIVSISTSYAQSMFGFLKKADDFLSTYSMKGSVDYEKIHSNISEIDELYDMIGKIELTNSSDAEKKAFYINAYNLIVIHQIATYYPLKSALDKSGFFDKQKHLVAGESLTLDGIEKGKVILKYGDPRVHFAFSCAAKGCPPLASFAFIPDELDDQLETRTKKAINNDYFIRVNPSEEKVEISKIFDWYKKDFTKNGSTVLSYINRYRDEKIPTDYRISYYEYDWALNDM